MEIEKFLLASSLVAVIAQTLVKKICPNCKKKYRAGYQELATLGINDVNTELILYKGEGCATCKNTGYLGRTAVYEIMKLDSDVRKMIMEDADPGEVKEYMRKTGMKTLDESCFDMVLKGITTFDEFIKISYSVEGK